MAEPKAPGVLYVDDEAINLRVFDANFKARFQVTSVASGKAALDVLRARPNDFGLVVTDQRMPEMTGVELLEQVHAFDPDIGRMVITAYADLQAVVDAVNRGQIQRYFVKPWMKDDLVASFDDALRIYRLSKKLQTVELRMLQSERLVALGQVSAGVAHELMNPVAYVAQNVTTLREDLKDIAEYLAPLLRERPNDRVKAALDELPELLGDVEKGTEHIKKVALGLKAQTRGDDGETESELSEVVEFASKLSNAEVRKHARLTVTKGPKLVVHGGPVKLTQVLLNLIVNAAQAMTGERPGVIEVAWRESGGDAVATVRDNGCGIPPENLERIFEPLFTTKKDVGTGLGLSISREIMREVGGDIRVTSQLGVGTTFELVFKKAG